MATVVKPATRRSPVMLALEQLEREQARAARKRKSPAAAPKPDAGLVATTVRRRKKAKAA